MLRRLVQAKSRCSSVSGPCFYGCIDKRGVSMRILWNYYLFLRERIFAFLEVCIGVLEFFFLFCGGIERKKPDARECCSVWR